MSVEDDGPDESGEEDHLELVWFYERTNTVHSLLDSQYSNVHTSHYNTTTNLIFTLKDLPDMNLGNFCFQCLYCTTTGALTKLPRLERPSNVSTPKEHPPNATS